MIEAIVPVPETVARRAWECACDLTDNTDIPSGIREYAYDRMAAGWVNITWAQARTLFEIHSFYHPQRT